MDNDEDYDMGLATFGLAKKNQMDMLNPFMIR
jgi:hypothetical protein